MADKTVMDMFADMAKQINLPKVDYQPFLDIHRKNIEAMQKSAATLSEGGRAVFAKQQEILAEVGREARQMIADFKPGGSPQEVMTKQAELARRMFEDGQCATPVPVRPNRPISRSSSCTQCACHTSGPVQPTLCA